MGEMDNNLVVCITGDIDYFELESVDCMDAYFSVLSKYDVPATFFVTSKAAECYPDRLEHIIKNNYEIAGHGDVHEGFYDSVSVQTKRLETMKNTFADMFDLDINGFRAPWYKHDDNTYQALRKAGIKYDCSKKRFEIAFKAIPYVQKTYMYTPTYKLTKPALKLVAFAYNHFHNCYQRMPYNVVPDVIEIPTLGISDYSLIGDPKGPMYKPSDFAKIANIWIECLSELKKSGGGILNLQVHPGRMSPDYVSSLDSFISQALNIGASFSTTGDVAQQSMNYIDI